MKIACESLISRRVAGLNELMFVYIVLVTINGLKVFN